MKNTIQSFNKTPWHFFLLSIYPILELWLLNIEQVSSKVIVRPLFAALAGALLIWKLASYFFKDVRRAAVLTTIVSIAFFSYGHVYLLLKGVQIFDTLVFSASNFNFRLAANQRLIVILDHKIEECRSSHFNAELDILWIDLYVFG